MKKILVITGSPRKNSNGAAIAEAIAAAAEAKGAQVEFFDVTKKKVNFCLACNACKGMERAGCVQKDDMGALLDTIAAADGIVLSAPIYFGQVPGTVKNFIDRLYCFFNPGKSMFTPMESKKCVVALNFGAGPAEAYAAVADEVAGWLKTVGTTEHKTLLCGGLNAPGSVSENTAVMEEAAALGAWIAE